MDLQSTTMARSTSSQDSRRETPSRLSDGSPLPPPPRAACGAPVQQSAESATTSQEESGTPTSIGSYLGLNLYGLEDRLDKDLDGIGNDLEQFRNDVERFDEFRAHQLTVNKEFLDKFATVVEMTIPDLNQQQQDTLQQMTQLEDVRIVGVESLQKDLQYQMNKLQSECDSRAVEAAKDMAKAEVARVERHMEDLSKTVAGSGKDLQTRVNGLADKIGDLAERISQERQSRVEDIHKRAKDFEELSRRVLELEKEREEAQKDREEAKKDREEARREREQDRQERAQEKRERQQEKKEFDDMMKEAKSNRTQGFRIPSVSRPSSSTSNRSSVSGTLDPPASRRNTVTGPAPGESRKRQATPSESPSRASTAKRPKGPVRAPSTMDVDHNPFLQTKRGGQASKPPTPSPSVSQSPTTKTSAGPAKQSDSQKQQRTPTKSTTSNMASTPKSKNKFKPEPAPAVSKRPREATPEGLSKVARDKFRYIRELASFDFTDFPKYKELREDYLAATHQFPLFKLEIKNEWYEYFLQTGEKDTVEPCPRNQVDGLPKETRQSDIDRQIVRDLGLVEGVKFGLRGRIIEKGNSSHYLLCLGEIYKSIQSSKTSKKESTGWFVFVDVAKKEKPVYMIWREKTYRDEKLASSTTWTCLTLGHEPRDRRDFFTLLPSINDWPRDPNQTVVSDLKIKRVLDREGIEAHMVFTWPLCAYLVQRLSEGWDKAVTFQETARTAPASAKT